MAIWYNRLISRPLPPQGRSVGLFTPMAANFTKSTHEQHSVSGVFSVIAQLALPG